MSTETRAFNQILRNNETTAWLVLILGVAACLRFLGLDFQSYWYDELFSAHISNPAHDFGTVVKLTLDDVHPPFFQLVMWWSYQIFGYTEWAGRLPSALAGVIGVGAIYYLGRELFSKRVGLYAAALAVANFYLLYYSQEARSYAFLYALCTLSFLFFVRALRSDSKRNLWAYVVVTLLLLYTHYFGFVLLIAQGACVLIYMQRTGWEKWGTLIRAGIAASIIIIFLLPLVSVISGHAAIDDFWIPQPGPAFIVSYFVAYFSSPWLALAMALLVIAGIGSMFVPRQADWQVTAVLILLAWIFIGYLLPWFRGFIGQPVLIDRNTIMLVPPLLILVARGLTMLPNDWLQRSVLTFLIAYSGYLLVFNLDYYDHIKKQQFRETARALGNFQPRLPVYTLKFNDTKYNVYFVQQGSDLAAADVAELESLFEDDDGPALLWLADGHRRTLQTDIDERFNLVEVGRIKNHGTVAALMVNPAKAVQLTMLEKANDEQSVYTSAGLPMSAFPMQLLVSAGAAGREEFTGEISIDLLASDGHVISSYANEPGSLAIVLPLGMIARGTGLRISLPADAHEPEVWLVP